MNKPIPKFIRMWYPSKELAAIVGDKPLRRTTAVKKLWSYIKTNNLQDPINKRNIHADTLLKPVFLKDVVSIFDMTKWLNKHLTDKKPLTYETVNTSGAID